MSIKNIIEEAKDMGIPGTYQIIPAMGLPNAYEALGRYFKDLQEADLLKYRYPDMDPQALPMWKACRDYYTKEAHTYVVIECCTGNIVSEIHLTEFSGKSAKLHFSQHPTNSSKLNKYLAKAITDCILNIWSVPGIKYTSFLDTLVGVTAVKNRAACLYVLRSGFTKVGVIPHCLDYLGSPEDAMISIKTRRGVS